jgi:hypothetical protein
VHRYVNDGVGVALALSPRSTQASSQPLTHLIVVSPPGASTTNSNTGADVCALPTAHPTKTRTTTTTIWTRLRTIVFMESLRRHYPPWRSFRLDDSRLDLPIDRGGRGGSVHRSVDEEWGFIPLPSGSGPRRSTFRNRRFSAPNAPGGIHLHWVNMVTKRKLKRPTSFGPLPASNYVVTVLRGCRWLGCNPPSPWRPIARLERNVR